MRNHNAHGPHYNLVPCASQFERNTVNKLLQPLHAYEDSHLSRQACTASHETVKAGGVKLAFFHVVMLSGYSSSSSTQPPPPPPALLLIL